ncbi:tetratricopeptide repeat protein [Pseudoalteromonas fenneropenaei]|uniref:Tetratricopeptide repeat protein n=1 Tax=Pseudoalteromonas fenneropenaei TaxID=1737459 RepID=A0ABV7CM15_9GAMM
MRLLLLGATFTLLTACGPTFDDAVKLQENGQYTEAATAFEKLATDGDLASMLKLIEWYDQKEPAKSFEWRLKAANKGDAFSQAVVGWAHDKGNDLPQNLKKPATAFEMYQKSAEQGLAAGQFYLGYAYDRGYGTPQDEKKALDWYKKSAAQEDSNALFILGNAISDGRLGLTANPITAIAYFCRAYRAGHDRAAPAIRAEWVNNILTPEYNQAVDNINSPQGVPGAYMYQGQRNDLIRMANRKKDNLEAAKSMGDEQIIKTHCN